MWACDSPAKQCPELDGVVRIVALKRGGENIQLSKEIKESRAQRWLFEGTTSHRWVTGELVSVPPKVRLIETAIIPPKAIKVPGDPD